MPRFRPQTRLRQHQRLGDLWYRWQSPCSAGRYGFEQGLGHWWTAGARAEMRMALEEASYFFATWGERRMRGRLHFYWRQLGAAESGAPAYLRVLPVELGASPGAQVDAVERWLSVVAFLDEHGLSAAAEQHLARCCALAEHTDLALDTRLSLLNQRGVIAQRYGNLSEAERHYREAFQLKPSAVVAANLGSLSFTAGRVQEACNWLQRALDLEDDPVERAQFISDLAAAREELGETEAALALFGSALPVLRACLGAHDPAVARTEANLGRLLYQQGRKDEGLNLLRGSHRTRRGLFGDRHLETANSANLLGLTLMDLGQLESAAPLVQQCLDIRVAMLGMEHPDTATAINNIALLSYRRRNYRAAADGFEQALEIYAANYGAGHPICEQLAAHRDAARAKSAET